MHDTVLDIVHTVPQPTVPTGAPRPPIGLVEIVTSVSGVPGPPGPPGSVIVADTPPTDPIEGQLWYESDTGVLYIWYVDADSAQWVQVSGAGIGDEAPSPSSELYVNPQAYGAAGDGVTADDSAVQTAVNVAFNAGREMYWTDVCLTTVSIPHLHEVRHYGPGAIKRGSALFYPCPKAGQTNNLYCNATSGDDANDGLSASQPKKELKAATAVLANYGPMLDGIWKVNAAAGTYKGQVEIPRNIQSSDYIYVLGADVSHPTVPTTIIDKAADTAMLYGVFADSSRLRIEDILVTGAFEQGVYCRDRAELVTRNVHVTNATVGIEAQNHTKHQIVGGIIQGCNRGIEELFGCISEFNAAGSLAAGTVIKNCVTGLNRKECCSGHIDWINFEDNQVHFAIHSTCTANVGDSSYKRGGPAVLMIGNPEIHEMRSATFGTGVDAPSVKFKKVGDGVLLEQTGWTGGAGPTIKTGFGRVGDIGHGFNTAIVVDGATTTSPTDVGYLTDCLQPGTYTSEGANFTVRLWGFVNNTGAVTANVITVQLWAPSAMVELSIPAGTANGTQFYMEWNVICWQDGNFQRCFGRGSVGGVAIVPVVGNYTATLDDIRHSVSFRVDLDNAADKLTITDRQVEG